MARLTIVRGSLWFFLVGLSARLRGSNLFSSKKTRIGFEKVWGVMRFSTFVRACMRYAWSRAVAINLKPIQINYI